MHPQGALVHPRCTIDEQKELSALLQVRHSTPHLSLFARLLSAPLTFCPLVLSPHFLILLWLNTICCRCR